MILYVVVTSKYSNDVLRLIAALKTFLLQMQNDIQFIRYIRLRRSSIWGVIESLNAIVYDTAIDVSTVKVVSPSSSSANSSGSNITRIINEQDGQRATSSPSLSSSYNDNSAVKLLLLIIDILQTIHIPPISQTYHRRDKDRYIFDHPR